MHTLQLIKQSYQAYFGFGGLGVLFAVAMIWFLGSAWKNRPGRKATGKDSTGKDSAGKDSTGKNSIAKDSTEKNSAAEPTRRRLALLIPALLIAAVCLCPISAWVIVRAIGQDVYWRVFWMVPVTAVVALLLTEVSEKAGEKPGKLIRRATAVIGLALLIVLNGNLVFNGAFFTTPTNSYKLPQVVVDIADIINEHASAHNIKKKWTVSPEEIAVSIRLYDPSITQAYGRNIMKNAEKQGQSELYQLINDEAPDLNALTYLAHKRRRRYIILRSEVDDRAVMEQCLFQQIGQVTGESGTYSIYFDTRRYKRQEKRTARAGSGWSVTQYGYRDVNSMFYAIYNPNPDGGLIIVDGGWREDANYVRSIIRRLGGKVDAWLLTHPHQDHCGAFNAIMESGDVPEIGAIYAVEMPSPEECLEVASWDSVDCLRDFLTLDIVQNSLGSQTGQPAADEEASQSAEASQLASDTQTAQTPQLTYVHRGDELTICGLPIKILNAFDEEVRERSHDYLNDGSMMFKITGPEKTMLFCADVGKSMSSFIYKQYRDELPSDYVQMGHHGNGGLKEKFYKKVNPDVAFFDAPDWLMLDPEGQYNTPEKIALMESLGSQILSFHSTPNSLGL